MLAQVLLVSPDPGVVVLVVLGRGPEWGVHAKTLDHFPLQYRHAFPYLLLSYLYGEVSAPCLVSLKKEWPFEVW